MLNKETKALYKQWYGLLETAMIKKIIYAVMGEDETKPIRDFKIKDTGIEKEIFIGMIEPEDTNITKVLRADYNCPYFSINEQLCIEFHKGGYAEDGKLITTSQIEELKKQFDWLSAYTCLNHIVVNQFVEMEV